MKRTLKRESKELEAVEMEAVNYNPNRMLKKHKAINDFREQIKKN